MMNFKRIFALCLALGMLAALVACGAPAVAPSASPPGAAAPPGGATTPAAPAPPQEATLHFWQSAITPERHILLDELWTGFSEENPHITLEFMSFPDATTTRQRLDMAMAANALPDMVHTLMLSDYIANGLVLPLNDWIDNSPRGGELVEDTVNFFRGLVDGHNMYLLSMHLGNTNVIWVRSDWIREAGMDIPRTWDDFFDVAHAISGPNRYGYSIRGGGGSVNTLEFMIFSYSGLDNFFDENGVSQINHPYHVQFLERYIGYYMTLTPEDDITKGWTELAATFQSGRAGMIVHNTGSAAAHAVAFDNDYTVFEAIRFPVGRNGRYSIGAEVAGYHVFTSAANNLDAAYAFLDYVFRADVNSQIGELWGNLPMNQLAHSDPWIQDFPWMRMAAEYRTDPNVQTYTAPFHIPEFNTIKRDLEPYFQSLMAGNITAQQFLDDWAERMTTARDDFYAAMR